MQHIGLTALVVADYGHVNGRRLIDYPRFANPATPCAACLVEAGQHWEKATVDAMLGSVAGLFAATGRGPPVAPRTPPRVAEVTHVVTANTGAFNFIHPYRGGDVIGARYADRC